MHISAEHAMMLTVHSDYFLFVLYVIYDSLCAFVIRQSVDYKGWKGLG